MAKRNQTKIIAIQNIQKIIDKALSEIYSRAKDILNQNSLELIELEPENGYARYHAYGTDRYEIIIKDFTKSKISVDCNCPYNWSEYCKHSIAALMHLKDILNNRSKLTKYTYLLKTKSRITVRKKNEPFEIPSAENLKVQLIKSLCNRSFFYFKETFVSVDISKKITFTIKEFFDRSKEVVIFKKGDKYFVNTHNYKDKYDKNYPLNIYEKEILVNIAKKNPKFLKEFFSPDTYEKLMNKTIRKYKLKDKQLFDKIFEFYIDEQNFTIQVRKKDEYENFIHTANDKNILTSIEYLTQDLPYLEGKSISDLRLAFILQKFEYKRNLLEHSIYGIIPAYGRPLKTKNSLSSYKLLYDFDDPHLRNIKLSPAQENLLMNIFKLNKIILNIQNFEWDEMENLHDTYKNIFQMLKNETHILINTHNSFNLNLIKYKSLKISKKHLKPVLIDENFSAEIFFELSKDEEVDLIKINPMFKLNDTTVPVYEALKESELIRPGFYYPKENKIYFLENEDFDLINKFSKPIYFKSEYIEILTDKVILSLSKKWKLSFDTSFPYQIESIQLLPQKKQIYLTEEDDNLIITPQVEYDQNISVKLSFRGNIYKINHNIITEFKRDEEFESDFNNFIASIHPYFENQKRYKIYKFPADELEKNLWIYEFFELLGQNNIEIFGLKELKKIKYSPFPSKITAHISSGIDWFDVNVNLSFGSEIVSLKDIKKAILNKNKFIQLKDGSIGRLSDEWLEKLNEYLKLGEIDDNNHIKISKLKFLIVEELFKDDAKADIIKEINEKKEKLEQLRKIEDINLPKSILASLRNYQKEGVKWLKFLDEMNWGGILADDMGLGKTLQIISFLELVKNKSKCPNLIVVPKTLLFNWQSEINKFCPSLKTYFHYGSKRIKTIKDIKKLNKYEVILTTYNTVINDLSLLEQVQFHYIILDESQAIKNTTSNRYKAAIRLKGKNKIALSGTPIENNTLDLYAQMNFVNPGFFGSIDKFKKNFSIPIDRNKDLTTSQKLQKMISPFILRRTKEQVAKELPPKTESIIYCEMHTEQRKIYDAYRNIFRKSVFDQINENGINKSSMFILKALTQLRMICDSPFLLKDEHVLTKESGKIKELLIHIKEKTSNHKLLIFSQFTSMLKLIEEKLDENNILYYYLDGKTSASRRMDIVNNFQNNENIRVFLISLKAGGAGLNITAADYVYIVDPWWNPAVENQAIDRTYRIGQTKSVFAYRMICKDSIEEKILNLQNKKKITASNIIKNDEHFVKNLDFDMLKELFD
ncbi:MAG: hypothetical protein KatS3mg034_1821 [Vicingaceae bacterium]|nr:MAG: hypothetical protein KatS3mg034_1255 [Vicingaceae bacterium]GIV42511.1 MAG: hypothetical protein KatS3mg034_1821 [Vicingaceae bacterium]